jgi:hypothetical protein
MDKDLVSPQLIITEDTSRPTDIPSSTPHEDWTLVREWLRSKRSHTRKPLIAVPKSESASKISARFVQNLCNLDSKKWQALRARSVTPANNGKPEAAVFFRVFSCLD